jgi:hypothetical protein
MSATSPWMRSRRWDLCWLVGSVGIVPAGILLVHAGLPAWALNLGVTALVGGPHLFATFLTTYLDPGFRRRHGLALLAITLLIPALVVWLAVTRFQVLLSLFLFWASIHVLQQNAYLADVYRQLDGRRDPASSRWIDVGFLSLSMYPIAAWKLVHDDFLLGEVPILLPRMLKAEATPWAVTGAFAGLGLAWILKTLRERREGRLNGPKTLLIGVTALTAFLIPAAAGGRQLELAFQAVNAWHSVQYLALVWLILELRRRRGQQESRFVASLSGPGWALGRFFGLLLGFTAALLAGVFALARWNPANLAGEQYYYMCVLSALLIHYALDTWLFFAATRGEPQPDRIALASPMAG